MTEAKHHHDGDTSPLFLSLFESDAQHSSRRLPKNKSTGNLLLRPEAVPHAGRLRFSFDAGALQEMDGKAM